MRWDAGRGFHVPGLAHKECASVDAMLNVRAKALALFCVFWRAKG